MQNLTLASAELFRRGDDERFESLSALSAHLRAKREQSEDRWKPPAQLTAAPFCGGLQLDAGSDGAFLMNDWSFGQLCKLAGVGKETVNRLSPETASLVFAETMPRGTKPLQLFTEGENLRSIHGTSYTRLHDADTVFRQRSSRDAHAP